MKIIWIILVVIIIVPTAAFADIETITATHKYVMGDNDSKNDARRMCFMEAKRKVLEKAGSYIESNTKVRNYQLAKDEIIAYSAALLKIETINEKWEIDGSNMAVTLTVKADVDASILEKQLARIQKDKSVQDKIKQQSIKLQELERTVNNLRQQLGTASSTKEPVLRKERNVVFKEIDELEEKKTAIVNRIQKKSRDARKHIIKGMTQQEVRSILGDPDKIGQGLNHDQWFYGATKIDFWYDIVHGVDDI
jgi:hypothetical protein